MVDSVMFVCKSKAPDETLYFFFLTFLTRYRAGHNSLEVGVLVMQIFPLTSSLSEIQFIDVLSMHKGDKLVFTVD